MPNADTFQRWRDLIADNQDSKVLRELNAVSRQNGKLREVILLNARTKDLQEKIIKGIIVPTEEHHVADGIRADLLDLIGKLERGEAEDPEQNQAWATVHIGGDVKNAAINSTIKTQGGDVILGDVYHTSSKKAHFLTSLPQNPPIFAGREVELASLHDKLFAESNHHAVILISGQGGVGKTSFASRYFLSYHHQYQHAAWLLKEGTIAEALLRLESGLHLQFTSETKEERLQIVLREVANLSAPCLLVLDNVNDRQDLLDHIALLRQLGNCHVLLTSRLDHFDGIERYAVNALIEPVAKQLFQEYYRPFSDEEHELFSEIYAAVDGNTLILQLLAKNLKKNRRGYTLANLWADLREKSVFELSRSKKVITDYGQLREGEVEDIVSAMFDLDDLTGDQQQLLSIFAALPADRIPYTHLEILVTVLEDLDDTLDELQQLGWLEENDDGEGSSFRCSPVVQAVVRRKVEGWEIVTLSLQNNIAGYLETDQSNNLLVGIASARPFVSYGEVMLPYLPTDRTNSYFFQQLTDFYLTSGDLQAAREVSIRREKGLRQLLDEQGQSADLDGALSNCLQKTGNIYLDLGDYETALKYYREAHRISKDLYDLAPNDPQCSASLAIDYLKLGTTYRALHKTELAISNFELAVVIWEELYAWDSLNLNYQEGLSAVYQNLGLIYQDVGNLRQALDCFEKSFVFAKQLYDSNPQNAGFKNGLAIAYAKLGHVFLFEGELDEAVLHFSHRYQLSKDLYAEDPDNVFFKKNLALAYSNLGNSHLAKGEWKASIDFTAKSHELYQELVEEHPYEISFWGGFVVSITELGNAHLAQGDYPKAVTHFENSRKTYEHLCTTYPANLNFKISLAYANENLARALMAHGKPTGALASFEQAIAILKEVSRTPADDPSTIKIALAVCYSSFGYNYYLPDEPKRALSSFQRSNALMRELHAKTPENVGLKNDLAVTYEQMGDAYTVIGDVEEALTCFTTEVQLFDELHTTHPENVYYKTGLAGGYAKLADTVTLPEDKEQYYRKSERLLTELIEAFPDNAEYQRSLGLLREKLDKL